MGKERVSIIRSDIRVPERSEDGYPCRSEDDPALSHTSRSETTNILKTTRNRYYP